MSIWSPFRENAAAEDETWLTGIPTPPEGQAAVAAGFEFGEAEAELEDTHPIATAFPLPPGVLEALSHGLTSVAIGLAAAAGYREVDQLTNVIFYFGHPDMVGRKIRPDEHALAKEWIAIRDRIVKPALGPAPAAHAPAAPVTAAELSSSLLQWPGASPEKLAFMRTVYDEHAAQSRASGRPFVADLPPEARAAINGHEARKDAAAAAGALLTDAKVALAEGGLAAGTRIGIVSAYRPATLQFQIWQGRNFDGTDRGGGFPFYYEQAQQKGVVHPGDYSLEAVKAFAHYLGGYIASPGYSNHQDGLAFDFGTSAAGKSLRAIHRDDWFRHWLEPHAARYHFVPLATEAWHWTYTPPAAAHDRELEDEDTAHLYDIPIPTATTGIRAGRLDVAHAPLLEHHRGVGPDLVLRWNDMSTMPSEVDVVVHLHGFWYPNLNLTRDIEPVSGLDLAPIDDSADTGRTRPTLTVLPRGNDTGVKQPRGPYNAYTFPALAGPTGLPALVDYALRQFASTTGATASHVGRLILTAHSGGGLALVEILQHHDPHQVHVFDALYWSPDSLIEWARRRIHRDRAAGASRDYMETQGGALRVFYQGRVRGGTRPNSLTVLRALERELSDGLGACYRVEASDYDHFQIPRRYGWRVLANASADVPDARGEPAPSHEAELQEHESPFGTVPEYDTPTDAGTPSATTKTSTVAEPFGTPPPAVVFGSTIGGISVVTGNRTLERLCCALADLTDDPANPPYVGVHDDEVLYVGSVQKLSAMYAAFLLRKQVRAQVAAAKAGGLDTSKHGWEITIVHDLLRDWAPKLRRRFPKKLPESLPQFGTIFEFTSTGDVRFPRTCTDEELAAIGFPGDPKGLFGDWLHLMIHWSNDEASSLCIRALGYLYINGALKDAGLFGGTPEHGLWLAGDYAGHDWLPHPPGHREINPAGQPLAKRWATAQGRTTSNMAATAQQLCKLLTLIARNDLVDAKACGEMRTLLDSRDAAGSYLDDALLAAGRRANAQFSKLGIGNDVSYHDCGIVERTITVGSGTKTSRYVVVGLGSKRTDQADLKLLFKTLDDLVVARHP